MSTAMWAAYSVSIFFGGFTCGMLACLLLVRSGHPIWKEGE